ncbi:MAG: UDP-N-acetylmuramoyl-L-alanyl-D-glutamate--2,6-diaminopimelate ligase [Phycisphaerales bacterium]
MKLGALIDGLGLTVHGGAATTDASAVRVCDITEDSRTALPGSLFIARSGTKTDGRKFIAAALDAGAEVVLADSPPDAALLREHPGTVFLTTADVPRVAAILAERYYGNPTSRLKLMGVTGTNGKTTVAHCVHRLLNATKRKCGLIGTVQIDDGSEVSEAVMTTPPACELSATFAHMLEAGCVAAAIEVSSHSLHQHRTTALNYACAVFTNLTGDHLDYHGTMEHYAAAKATLFELLPPTATAIVNVDDPWHQRMLQDCRAKVLRCSLRGAGGEEQHTGGPPVPPFTVDCRVEAGEPTFAGTRVRYLGPWGAFEINLSMVGRHNLMNTLQAVAAAWAMGAAGAGAGGVPLDELARAATLMEAPPGRLERVAAPERGGASDDFAVFVDYAHTDDALANVLRAARPLVRTGSMLRVVFGCGGDRDRTKRPRMARTCCELADHVTITSDNPRTEKPSAIIDEILTGVPAKERSRVDIHADRRQAIFHAVGLCRAGDVLVIAGKGHETYQLLPDGPPGGGAGSGGIRRIDFDDRIVAREALRTQAVPV